MRTESPKWRAIFRKGMLRRDSGLGEPDVGGAEEAESALEALECRVVLWLLRPGRNARSAKSRRRDE